MSWTIQDFQRLGNLLVDMQDAGGTPDPDSEEFKKVEALLGKLYRAFQRSNLANITVDQIINDLDKRRELVKKRGEIYLTEEETTQQLIAYGRRAEQGLKEKILMLYNSEEASEEDIELLREELRIVQKSNKLMDAELKATQKGAATAEAILQATLGIRKNSMNVMAGVKGFGKGLKKSLNTANLFATAMSKLFEAYGSVDSARANLFKNTGMTGYTERIIKVGNSLVMAHGANSKEVAGQMYEEINKARRSYGMVVAKEMDNMADTAGKLKRLGVSVEAYTDITTFMSMNLGQSTAVQNATLARMFALGKDSKISPELMFREVAESIPIYSRYGNQFGQIFAGIHLAAKKTNVNIADLMTLTESLDQSDAAFKQAQKFNALLGGNFLNPTELLIAKPGEKIKLIADAYQRANQAIGNIHPRIVRDLYRNFGVDAQQFNNIVNARFEDYDKELNAVTKGNPKLQELFKKNIAQTMSVTESLDKSLAAILSKVIYELLPSIVMMLDMTVNLVKGVMDAVKGAAKFLKELFGDDEEFMDKREKEERRFAAQMYGVDRDFDFANAVAENFDGRMSSEVLDMVVDSHLPPILLRDNAVDALVDIKKSSILEEGTSDFEKLKNIYAAREKEQEKIKKEKELSHGLQALSTVPVNDTPIVMPQTTSRSVKGTLSPVRTVKEKFQTSNQDDVLLSRLTLLSKKLHQYRQKTTKVNLNVGLNNIAEVEL